METINELDQQSCATALRQPAEQARHAAEFVDQGSPIRCDGVPQGSVLGPLLFNIYINDLFFELDDNACNFADDTTSFVCEKNLEIMLLKLEKNVGTATQWFTNNHMKMNPNKCHLIVAGHKWEMIWANIGEIKIWEENSVKLLGVTTDNKLRFDAHLSEVC